jgi:hypothetical protein
MKHADGGPAYKVMKEVPHGHPNVKKKTTRPGVENSRQITTK